MSNTPKKLYLLVAAALFAALIFLGTYLFHIPTATGGYIHVGDTFIYLAACLLPYPYAAAAAAVGASLSDFLAGSAIYVPATFVIKAVLPLFFTAKGEKLVTKRNVLALLLAGLAGLAGYYFYEAFVVCRNFLAPLLELSVGWIQPAASGVLFVIIGTLFDRTHIKARFLSGSVTQRLK